MNRSDGHQARRGALGGAANEAGSIFRGRVAAWAIVHGLVGRDLPNCDLPHGEAVPVSVALEADSAIDDIAVGLSGGGTAFFQAKHSLALSTAPGSAFFSAISQWKEAVQAPEFDHQLDRLIVVADRMTGPVEKLESALRRRRAPMAGAPTKGEQQSLGKLVALISDLPASKQQSLLDTGSFLSLSLDVDGLGDAGTAEALLRAAVVPADQAASAWHELTRVAWELAGKREGRRIDGWADSLRNAGCELLADAALSAAAEREAMRGAVARYRARVEEDASTIDLRGLGLPVSPLPAGLLSPVRVQVNSTVSDRDQRDRGSDLIPALLRRGKALLLGLPGSGKSTALRLAAAQWAARSDWPLPVVIDLRDVPALMGTTIPIDCIVNLVVPRVPPNDRPLVEKAVREGLQEGKVALFFDGLDETRDKRFEVASWVDQLLDSSHDECELFISTRDSGYSAAATLNFKELRILPPTRLEPLLHAVIDALAPATLSIDSSGKATWTDIRRRWVAEVLERDSLLSETPLVPLLLAALASQSSDTEELPRRRARVLSRVLENAARTWEMNRRKPATGIGALNETEVQDALLDSFERLAYSVLLEAEFDITKGELLLAPWFEQDWGMPRSKAITAAKDAIHFWDEAGVLVAHGANRVLIPRIRLMAEIGAARDLSKGTDPDTLQSRISELLSDETAHETLILAAGLSSSIADTLVGLAVDGRTLQGLSVAATAVAQGAEPSDDILTGLIEGLLAQVDATHIGWIAAKLVVKLPCSVDMRVTVAKQLKSLLPPHHASLATALMRVRSEESSGPWLRAALLNGPPGRNEKLTNDSGVASDRWKGLFVEEAFNDLVRLVSQRVLPDHPEIAHDLYAASRQASHGVSRTVNATLREQGFGTLTAEDDRQDVQLAQGFLRGIGQYHARWNEFLALFERLAPAADLTPAQLRRCGELADLVASIEMYAAGVSEVNSAVLTDTEDFAVIVDMYATTTGLDKSMLSAEAISIGRFQAQEGESFGVTLLFDDGEATEPDRWNSLEDPDQTRRQLCALTGHANQWLAHLAAHGLAYCPDKDNVVLELEASLLQLIAWNRRLVSNLIAWLDGTTTRARAWRSESDPILRGAAARLTARLYGSDQTIDTAELVEIIGDDDAGVREQLIRNLNKSMNFPANIRALITELAERESPEWLCIWCGHVSGIGTTACDNCSVVGPDSRKAALELLGAP